jgi:hypothetical protein
MRVPETGEKGHAADWGEALDFVLTLRHGWQGELSRRQNAPLRRRSGSQIGRMRPI